MGRVHIFNTHKFVRNLILLRIEIGFLRSSPLPRLFHGGLLLFGACSGIEASLLLGGRRAAETLVPEVCLRHLRWIGDRRSSSSLVRVRVLRGPTRVALHPYGCSKQLGGCET